MAHASTPPSRKGEVDENGGRSGQRNRTTSPDGQSPIRPPACCPKETTSCPSSTRAPYTSPVAVPHRRPPIAVPPSPFPHRRPHPIPIPFTLPIPLGISSAESKGPPPIGRHRGDCHASTSAAATAEQTAAPTAPPIRRPERPNPGGSRRPPRRIRTTSQDDRRSQDGPCNLAYEHDRCRMW
ncbi:hypothetical protein DCS_05451 [Drechmeria coniospora]|uniref:Uncharacterized protein n=1 Tax=Drechmeria coniospora TaxID=98403 RepID=A0A151GMW2_DRECN|nr:hypothetical protein DCS_05451 [Drechmeria coniospora]KYK58436.1 hypothetical protein DCS_05451 [Drechmeria coniospora]